MLKDQKLIAEAYQKILEAPLQTAANVVMQKTENTPQQTSSTTSGQQHGFVLTAELVGFDPTFRKDKLRQKARFVEKMKYQVQSGHGMQRTSATYMTSKDRDLRMAKPREGTSHIGTDLFVLDNTDKDEKTNIVEMFVPVEGDKPPTLTPEIKEHLIDLMNQAGRVEKTFVGVK